MSKSYSRKNTNSQTRAHTAWFRGAYSNFEYAKIGIPSTLAGEKQNARRVAWVEHRSTNNLTLSRLNILHIV